MQDDHGRGKRRRCYLRRKEDETNEKKKRTGDSQSTASGVIIFSAPCVRPKTISMEDRVSRSFVLLTLAHI